MPTTIYDVAKRAGVSTATVSKVLSDTPYVSERTRAKVLSVVRELDFVPSLAARSLSRAHTDTIGLVFPYAPDYLFDDPHLLTFMLGVEQVVADHDCNILLATARPDDEPASSLRRFLRTRYVDAAILVAMQTIQPIADELRHRAQPTVALGYASPTGVHNTIHAEDSRGGALAAEHLLALGHRRMGLISGPEEITAVSERVAGFVNVLAAAGITLQPEQVAAGDFTALSGFAAAARLFSAPAIPTAIFAVNDRMALGCISCAQQRGLVVPADLSVVGFDDIPAAAFSSPPLTTVRQPSLEMGRLAAQRVFQLIEGVEDGFDPTVLPVSLVTRGSTQSPCRSV